MAHHDVSTRFGSGNTAPQERGSWVPAIVATALLVPLTGALFFLFGLSAMAFDSCASTAACPDAAAAVDRASAVGTASIPVALTTWLWPRARRYNGFRRAHLGVYLALVATSAWLLVTMPAGR